MVQLEEVEDDELKQLQLGKEFIDDDDFTDTGTSFLLLVTLPPLTPPLP